MARVTRAGHFSSWSLPRQPLTQLMHQGELSLSRAVTIVIDIAMALTEAHARGVIHRDIKPSNIMIDDRGQVRFSISAWRNNSTKNRACLPNRKRKRSFRQKPRAVWCWGRRPTFRRNRP